MWSSLLDIILPEPCVNCRRPGAAICAECLSGLRPSASGEGALAAFDYDDPVVQKTVWALKYRGRSSLARRLAKPLYDLLLEELAEYRAFSAAPALLVPVPLHPRRERERGYNQAALLAKHLAACDRQLLRYHGGNLRRLKDTPSQVSLRSRSERLINLRGVFGLAAAEAIRGRTIVLLDDVTTTGTTLRESEAVLRASGAERVIAAALARGG